MSIQSVVDQYVRRSEDVTPGDGGWISSPPDMRILLSVEEAAHRLGVGRTSMYGLIGAGDIESVTVGRLRRVPVDALTDYVTRIRQTGGAPMHSRRAEIQVNAR